MIEYSCTGYYRVRFASEEQADDAYWFLAELSATLNTMRDSLWEWVDGEGIEIKLKQESDEALEFLLRQLDINVDLLTIPLLRECLKNEYEQSTLDFNRHPHHKDMLVLGQDAYFDPGVYSLAARELITRYGVGPTIAFAWGYSDSSSIYSGPYGADLHGGGACKVTAESVEWFDTYDFIKDYEAGLATPIPAAAEMRRLLEEKTHEL